MRNLIRSNRFICCIVVTSFWAANAVAAAAIEQCPAEVITRQTLAGAHKGWRDLNESTRHPLHSIRFSEGDPSEMAWLAPTSAKGPSIQNWILPKSASGYWVSCGYGSTNILLTLRLPANTVNCTVWFDKDYQPPIALKYLCK